MLVRIHGGIKEETDTKKDDCATQAALIEILQDRIMMIMAGK
jgi:hypothetical protein